LSRPRAARFDNVGDDDAAAQIAYLDEQARTSFWRARKAFTLDLLELRPGTVALDVGCGTGEEVRAMAARAGRAVGIDFSRALIEEARRRTTTDEAATFKVGDALALPFGDGEFDGVRTERTLQHVKEPLKALREMARVARPGAPVVAIEPDWDTLTLNGEPFEVTLAVCRRWADSIRNPRVGRELPELMAEAGLERVEARADTSEITSLAFAARQFALQELARAAAEHGDVPQEEAERWLFDLTERDDSGRFEASVTYVTARGLAPG
jgi:ubiquinone/menaquinone biosynthesis C-methylase UbiE